MKEVINWIDVKERPLITRNEKGEWKCTEDGENEFIAAVPYENNIMPGKIFWWIRLCVILDEIGLCVVGDDDNEAAGWDIDSITHYFHLPKHPKQ